MATSARPDPPGCSAASMESCSCDLMDRAALRIQNTMEVRMPAATTATTPSNSSCCACGNSSLARFSPMPRAKQSTLARTTPDHTSGSIRARPVWLR